MMRWLHFIWSHSVFISFCAVALCYQTYHLLDIVSDNYVYGLVFFSTLASYNLYWLISKFYFRKSQDILAFLRKNASNIIVFCVAGCAIGYCLLQKPFMWQTVMAAVFLTLLYSIPLWPFRFLAFTRKAGFVKTLLLAFTWTYVTIMLPLHTKLFVNTWPEILLFTARFLFMLMLCIIFDARDITIDKINSLRSLATDVNRKTLLLIMTAVFILYLAAGFLLRYYFSTDAQLIAFIITGLFTLVVYLMSLRPRGYFFYYFMVDGLMLFSATATYVASI
jgi:4-hydroxybenzoate polyprenyltransferase